MENVTYFTLRVWAVLVRTNKFQERFLKCAHFSSRVTVLENIEKKMILTNLIFAVRSIDFGYECSKEGI